MLEPDRVYDFPALRNNPATPMRERKRLIRLLITDATLIKTSDGITVQLTRSGGRWLVSAVLFY